MYCNGSRATRKNVPPFIRVARDPLQYIGVNTVGLSRRGFDKEVINQIEDIYRLLFVRGHNVTNALELIEQEIPASNIKTQIMDFVRNSKDGIVKGI
jgi:UDP-N-acetylglucosamine acyltransferase